jgi:hypothetical protein
MVGPRRKPYALRVFRPTHHDIDPAMLSGGSGREWFEDTRSRRSTDLPGGDRMENIGAGNCGDPLTCREHRIGELRGMMRLARCWRDNGASDWRQEDWRKFTRTRCPASPNVCTLSVPSGRKLYKPAHLVGFIRKIVGGGRRTTDVPTVFATFAVVCFSARDSRFFLTVAESDDGYRCDRGRSC